MQTYQQQDIAISNILWKLGVEELWQSGLLIALDQNLAQANLAAALGEGLLHTLSGTDDATGGKAKKPKIQVSLREHVARGFKKTMA